MFPFFGRNQNGQFFNNPMQMIQQFNQFKQTFQGDPRQQVQNLLDSGQMSQEQFNQLSSMAQMFQQLIGKQLLILGRDEVYINYFFVIKLMKEVQHTMSLSENGNGMVMPVGPMYGNGANGSWFGDGGLFWIIILFLFAWMGNGWGKRLWWTVSCGFGKQ